MKLKENGLNYYLYPAIPTHPVTDWWANATLAATRCHRGNQVHHRRPVKDDAGEGGLPRGYAWACWKEGAEANPMVAAPLPNGRRSNSGECEQRRC
jgi:hypothetical protein